MSDEYWSPPETPKSGHAIHHRAAHAANSFAAVMIELDRFFILSDQLLVQHVEHLEERCLVADRGHEIGLEPSRGVGTGLTPDLELDVGEMAHL